MHECCCLLQSKNNARPLLTIAYCFSFQETLLLAFVASTRILYKDLAMTFNVHQLLHLAEAARQMGPLWGHSAFVFESGNGHLVKLVTGANAVPSQIVERVVMEQHLECLLTSPLLSDSCKEMCNRMLGYPKLLNFMSVGEVGLLGCPHKLVLSEQLKSALSEYVDECPDLAAEYTRFVYKGQIFRSRSHKKPFKSDSSVVQTHDLEYFVIQKILCLRSQVLLVCDEIVTTASSVLPTHIKECFISMARTRHVVKPHAIKASCLFFQFQSPAISYVCDLANSVERD